MPTKKQKKSVKQRTSNPKTEKNFESDGAYFLKLVLVFLLQTFWLKFATPLDIGGAFVPGFPLGFFVGLLLIARYEHFQSDRKIWYAILLVATIISYFLPAGVVI